MDALNTMMLSDSYEVVGTEEDLCSLLACLPIEFRMAISQLKLREVAEIAEQNGNITLTSRKRKREWKIKEERRKAGRLSGVARTKHEHDPEHGVGTKGGTRSASASASASASGLNPTKEMAEKWLDDWKKSGADYTMAEMESAFLALSANGWMWGKNPVVDFRAALERQIQTDRQRGGKPPVKQTVGGNF
jgi:hypothetical protein